MRQDVDLRPYNSYRLCARCARAFFPETEREIRDVYRLYPSRDKILIGSGHNIILAREWYEEDFVIFNGNFDRITVEGTVMDVQAGAFSARMSEVALEHGLTGLEFLWDIPSSLGGAVVMNAGAGGDEIKNHLVSVRFLDLYDLTIHEIRSEEVGFAYRNSLFQQDPTKVVLSAKLQLQTGDPYAIRMKMNEVRAARWAKQPRDFPNAGSVFKRPKGRFVGPMLDELGLKGFGVGGVKVSEKHSGFIIRHAEATGHDVLDLIETIQKRVQKAYGVQLEIEQRVIR